MAQVRREIPQNQDIFAVGNSVGFRDDLLTRAVDNADLTGL
jgi:hypothetical protein